MCKYCDEDVYGRQPINYKLVCVGSEPLMIHGTFIEFDPENSSEKMVLQSYLLNAEYDFISQDNTPINYCPVCGRKLRSDEKGVTE